MKPLYILALFTLSLGGITPAPKVQAFTVPLTIQAGQTAAKTWVTLAHPSANLVCVASASDEYGGTFQANSQMINGRVSVTVTTDTPPAAAITAQVSVICTPRTQ